MFRRGATIHFKTMKLIRMFLNRMYLKAAGIIDRKQKQQKQQKRQKLKKTELTEK